MLLTGVLDNLWQTMDVLYGTDFVTRSTGTSRLSPKFPMRLSAQFHALPGGVAKNLMTCAHSPQKWILTSTSIAKSSRNIDRSLVSQLIQSIRHSRNCFLGPQKVQGEPQNSLSNRLNFESGTHKVSLAKEGHSFSDSRLKWIPSSKTPILVPKERTPIFQVRFGYVTRKRNV